MAEYNRLVRIEGAVQLMDKAQFEVTLKTPTDPKPTKKKPRTRSK
jgi:hypothetical protein